MAGEACAKLARLETPDGYRELFSDCNPGGRAARSIYLDHEHSHIVVLVRRAAV